jgi:hypothetical protein
MMGSGLAVVQSMKCCIARPDPISFAFVMQAGSPVAARFFDHDLLLDQSIACFDALNRFGYRLVTRGLGCIEQAS